MKKKIITGVIIVLAILIAFGTYSNTIERKAVREYNRGHELVELGRYYQVTEHFEKAIDLYNQFYVYEYLLPPFCVKKYKISLEA